MKETTELCLCFHIFVSFCRLSKLGNGRSSGTHQSASFSSSSIPVRTSGVTELPFGKPLHMGTSLTGSVIQCSPVNIRIETCIDCFNVNWRHSFLTPGV